MEPWETFGRGVQWAKSEMSLPRIRRSVIYVQGSGSSLTASADMEGWQTIGD